MENVNNLVINDYPGLDLYFLSLEEEHKEKIIKNATFFQAHINRNCLCYPLQQIEKDHFFMLDYKLILSDEHFILQWPEFNEELINSTEFTLNTLGFAMYDHINQIRKDIQNEQKILKALTVIRVRIVNFEPILLLKDVNVNYFGKFVSLCGTVIKASMVKIICNVMAFYCEVCQQTQVVKQANGVYTPLEKCQTHGCRTKGHFKSLYNSPLTKTVYWQSITIQESDSAMVPQTLECELTADLVNSCSPGDDINISGVIKVRDPNSNKCKNKQNSVFNLYLEVVSVYNNKTESEGSNSHDIMNFTSEDYYAIKEIHANPNLFTYLVNSLSPSIYGHELIKAGLLLALFKGTKSNTSRAESHVLLIGDPGLGKSQMLKSCTNVSPRGVYVCGSGSTTSGLTVTMTRETGGEYSLEAGALMLSDQGCCCIDEFDKMPTQHAGLLEAMEQQSISIAKAGVVCSLPTKPTLLVAANPAGGHYNKAKTVAENLKIGSPMLSRFDLIFILLDKPDEARAKAELREEATEDDARDVIEIMKHSIVDIFTNEDGMLDTTRSQMGTGMSFKNQVLKLVEMLQRKSEIESKSLFTLQEIKNASESVGILQSKFTNTLQSLNIQGYLLSKGRNTYQLNSAYL
ncbi:DNA helicase MCM8-like isoform X2 [Sitophilus oryzae]|uniref:DNA helicase MCM8 n=1 Tax=Sitophilus oryzae TaxID=7048 RepID=A0A6J2X2E6_SITOR|nr:DNA helicase MCM8-like isoform X2 [Sitophilus oryzae]